MEEDDEDDAAAGSTGGGAGDTGYGAGAGGGSGYAKSSVTSSVTGTTGTGGGMGSVTVAAPEASSTYYVAGIAEGGSPSMHGGNGRRTPPYPTAARGARADECPGRPSCPPDMSE